MQADKLRLIGAAAVPDLHNSALYNILIIDKYRNFMPFIYHQVPRSMKGGRLFPLNELRDVMPEIYETEIKKYAGREHLLDETVPILNCLWNDVLHFSLVHPVKIKETLLSLGNPFHYNFFEVPAEILDPSKTVIYLYLRDDNQITSDQFIPFSPYGLEGLGALPQLTSDYYAQTVRSGKKLYAYHGIPHVLRSEEHTSELQSQR